MKTKRIVLIFILTVIFITCFQSMNTRYDPLARYSYNDKLTPEQKELIIDTMSNDDIDYIIQAKLKPQQFLKYINLEGFTVKNTLYYEKCAQTQSTEINKIVQFVNTYRKHLSYKTLDTLLSAYSYDTLAAFYDGLYTYDSEATLIVNPSDMHTMISKGETIYKYEPKDLVILDTNVIPIASILDTDITYVHKDVVEPLKQLCDALKSTNDLTCGGLILTKAYVSYEDQTEVYEKALVQYGVDTVESYEDKPGQSEHQLGYTLTFTIAGLDAEKIKESDQVKWLNEHAEEYGFIIRYPLDAEAKTGKFYQPLTLRYIGDKTQEENFDFIAFLSGDN